MKIRRERVYSSPFLFSNTESGEFSLMKETEKEFDEKLQSGKELTSIFRSWRPVCDDYYAAGELQLSFVFP